MRRSHLVLVSDNHVFELDRAEGQPYPFVVGTDAWYNWLKDHQIQSFCFKHPLGTFTARCEHRRQGLYWYAYRKREGRLRKVYLGKTEKLTQEWLSEIAILMGQSDNVNVTPARLDRPDRNASRVSLSFFDDEIPFSLTPISTYTTKPGQATKHNLPSQLTSLIGREKEVAEACVFLRQPEIRLLTLSGVGGVGKTCLGLQIATDLFDDFADGVCFVSLVSISDPDLVVPAIAHTLGLRERRSTSHRTTRSFFA